MSSQIPKKGDLRVWWIPQIPMEKFTVSVGNTDEARKILDILANYDLFQFENNIKPDYANAGGLEEFDGRDWCEWGDEYGSTIDELTRDQFPTTPIQNAYLNR